MSFTVLGIGELVWDLLPTGPQLGGAPANFAVHAGALGADARLVTRVGNDLLGQDALKRFDAMNLSRALVQVDAELPTGTVTVTLGSQGTAQFTIAENAAWDRIMVTQSAHEAVRQAAAICFGSLAQRSLASRATIQQLVGAAPVGALRLFDVNLRQSFYSLEVIESSLRLANVLKLNEEELPILTGMFSLQGDVRRRMEALREKFGLKTVVLTRGPGGSLIRHERRWSEQPPQSVPVVDTVGAGDAFTATLTMGLLNKWDLGRVHSLAAEAARYVCSQAGATPQPPAHLRSEFVRANSLT